VKQVTLESWRPTSARGFDEKRERETRDSLIGSLLVDVLEDRRKSFLWDIVDAESHRHAALLEGDVERGKTVGVCRTKTKRG